jgi:hypothetical protein
MGDGKRSIILGGEAGWDILKMCQLGGNKCGSDMAIVIVVDVIVARHSR